MAFVNWELPSVVRGRRMDENEISVICNGKERHSITFNTTISEEVLDKGYTHIQIKQDPITGEIGFSFNNNEGLNIRTTGPKREDKKRNICLENKQWVNKLAIHLDIPTDGTRTLLEITKNLSTIDKCMFYRIIKIKR